jgi:hypothetical protein
MTFPVLTTSLDLLRNVAAGIRPDQLDDRTPCSDWTVAQLLLHAAGDQYAWASSVGSSPPPAYNPFAPAKRLDGSISELIDPAIQAATNVWSGIDSGAESVPTPLPPVPTMAPELAAAPAHSTPPSIPGTSPSLPGNRHRSPPNSPNSSGPLHKRRSSRYEVPPMPPHYPTRPATTRPQPCCTTSAATQLDASLTA